MLQSASKIVFRRHFKFRAGQRKISKDLANQVYLARDQNYFDNLRKHYVALKKVKIESKARTLMLAYDKIGNKVEFITIHIIKEKEIKNKIQSGRWIHEN